MSLEFLLNSNEVESKDEEMVDSGESPDPDDDAFQRLTRYLSITQSRAEKNQAQGHGSLQQGIGLVNLSTTVATRWQPLTSRSRSRPARPGYSEEELFFIWYTKCDLDKSWDEVVQDFKQEFLVSRGKSALQSKYYRILINWRVTKIRERSADTEDTQCSDTGPGVKYGVIQRTNVRYRWMRPEHRPPH